MEEIELKQAGTLNHYGNDQMNRVYATDGLALTITVKSGGGREQKIAIKSAVGEGVSLQDKGTASTLPIPDSKTRRGRVGKGVSQTLLTNSQMGTLTESDEDNPQIRKFTEEECFRLMGVKKEDFNKVKKHQPPTSLYHLPGDSIVTTCLMALFGEMLGIDYETKIEELAEQLKGETH